MKISRSNPIKENFSSPSKVERKNKKFSSEFHFFNQEERKNHLQKLLGKINKKGKHIITTNSLRAVEEYKIMIHEYLTLILKAGYHIKKVKSPWDTTGSMTLISVLDKELDNLSTMILEEQQDTLAIINKVDCISGILIDAYQ